MTTNDWYYTMGGQQQGPVPLEHLKQWLASGQIQPAELVWREGMPNWIAAQQVPELQGIAPAPIAGAQQAGFAGGASAPFSVNYYTPTQAAEYAGFWARFCAVFIDGLIVGVPFFLLGMLVNYSFGVQKNPPSPAHAAVSGFLQLANLVAGWLYEAMLISGPHQATLGKQALGIRVTDMNGQRISFGRSTGRYFAKILSGCTMLIGYIMAAFTERKQALHDMIASTLVLKGPPPQQ